LRPLPGPIGLEEPLEELVLHISAMRIQPAEDLTMMQQQNPISHPSHLIQMLAGHQDRNSVFTGPHPQQLTDPDHPQRVEAVAGFIQNQHIRPMNQRHGEPKTVPIAQRQSASRSMLPMVQIDRTAVYVEDLEGIRTFYENHFDAQAIDRYRVLAVFAYQTRVRATPDASAVIGPAG
jgi:hypothetical protein